MHLMWIYLLSVLHFIHSETTLKCVNTEIEIQHWDVIELVNIIQEKERDTQQSCTAMNAVECSIAICDSCGKGGSV